MQWRLKELLRLYPQNVDSISQVEARWHVLLYYKDVIAPKFELRQKVIHKPSPGGGWMRLVCYNKV